MLSQKNGSLVWQENKNSNFHNCLIVSWIGTQLGNCTFEEFNTEAEKVYFRVKSYSNDDFCSKHLSITMKDAAFESNEMNDWVDQSKGGYLRTATKNL